MPFGSKIPYTQNAYIGKANIPSYTTTNFDKDNNVIASDTQNVDRQLQQGSTQSTDGKNVTSNISNQGKLY